MNDPLHILDTVQKVDAPPYMYARILRRIEQRSSDYVSATVAWSVGFAFALLLVVNIAVVLNQKEPTQHHHQLAEEFHLQTNNSLYH